MERMMPIDLERAELRKRFRGYDRAQVRYMLQQAAKEMSALRGEVESLQYQVNALKSEIETFRAQESTLKEALILAQRTADEVRASAHREADVIVEEAKQKTSEIEQQTHQRINDLRWELERLRLEKQKFINSYRAMLEVQMRDLVEASGLSVIDGEAPEHAVEA